MIRLFKPSDLNALHQLIQRTIDTCYPKSYPQRAVDFFKRYHSEESILKRAQEGEILVVEKEGSLIGTGSIISSEITGVFVDPGSQGQQLGRSIMQKLEHLARNQGVTNVNLSISLPSKKFYQELNYQIGEHLQIDVGEGQVLHYFTGTKKI